MIAERPIIQESLARGIINYGALADIIKPDIEKELNKEIKHSAVMMALRRHAEKLERKFEKKIKFNKDTDITIKSNLVEITVEKTPTIFKELEKLYKIVDFSKGDILTITQGNHEVTIISNDKYKDKVLKSLGKEKIISKIDDLVSLSISLPENAINEYGLFYLVGRALTWENISIVEVVSTFRELTLILKEKDSTKAFNAMQKLIKS